MFARTTVSFSLVALIVCTATVSQVAAQGKGSDSVVKAIVKAEKPGNDGKQQVTITLTIDPKYHLYANPVGNEDFKTNQTVVVFPKSASAKVEYPAGKVEQDKILGEYKIYKGTTTIKATLQRTKGDKVSALIKIQACSDKACLMPSTLKVNVP